MKITWFGHSAFRARFRRQGRAHRSVLHRQPRIRGRPRGAVDGVTHILVTHGHGDHVGDTVAIAKETGAKVVTNYDLCMYLAHRACRISTP